MRDDQIVRDAGLTGETEARKRGPARRRLWIGGSLIGVFFFCVVPFVNLMREQIAWRPTDRSRIRVESFDYARQGIALTVRSTGPVQEVWRQASSFMPWRSQHELCAFRAKHIADGVEQILVEYEFVPEREWLLALRSADGFWVAMSPYFPSQPDLDEQAWRELWSAAERRVPR